MQGTSSTDAMDRLNHRAYEGRAALRAFQRSAGLSPAERVILKRLRPRIAGVALLDIGVGAGRTTPYLLEISRRYTAIDYSRGMVERARKRLNLDSILCCDVREMSIFSDEQFDFAFFSFNGLDYIAHQDRLRALAEIRRVLKPGGLFLFSSHNRACLGPGGRRSSSIKYSPLRALKRGVMGLLLIHRHLRMRRDERATAEYAIVNDSGLNYSILTYYISISAQLAQLKNSGFKIEAFYDDRGEQASEDCRAGFVHYLAVK
jgi:SAM-dependent methyltransferase